METQLKVLGKEHIGKIEFTGIEGGPRIKSIQVK